VSNQPTNAQYARHALGLPAGSVRALLAFGVLGYLWIIALVPGILDQPHAPPAFVFMQLVMILVLCHFIVAHGKTIGQTVSPYSPLYMPRGVVRIILLVGYFGLAYWTWKRWSEGTAPQIDNIELVLFVGAMVMGAFLLGHISSNVMRWLTGGNLPSWFLDVQAWVGLVALFLLAWVLIARLVINPTTTATTQLSLKYTEPAMAALVAFYFGARS
jgi:hypothetical protein